MKPSIKRLDHVALISKDLERSVAFYRDTLGLEQVDRPDFDFPGAWFSLGGTETLHIIVSKDSPHASPGHFAVEASGIERFATQIADSDIPRRGPKRRPDGALQFFLEDPDGNTIELTSDLPRSGR